jgi:hypothetical protein
MKLHRPMALHHVDQGAAHGSTVGESMTKFMRLAVESKWRPQRSVFKSAKRSFGGLTSLTARCRRPR